MLFDDERAHETATALPDFAYPGGLRPGVDLYDKDSMADLLCESSR